MQPACAPNVVGSSIVNGVPAEHFAYMEPGINWEIWIESGNNALPLRLAMTYKQAPNFPRFLFEYSDWNLSPKLSPDTFVFKMPANSKQIEFALAGLSKKQSKWKSMN
jgi:hypothetical protein